MNENITQQTIKEMVNLLSQAGFKIIKKGRQDKKVKSITRERLLFIYSDLLNKLNNKPYGLCERYSRKVNHYRQLLNNNKHVWNYLEVTPGLNRLQFNAKYGCNIERVYWKATAYIDPELSIKELIIKFNKPSINPLPNTEQKDINGELQQHDKHKANKLINQYKITITDCSTGNLVQEFYLPKGSS